MSFNIFDEAAKHEATNREREARDAANRSKALASISVLRTISKVLSATLSDTTVIYPEETERRSRELIQAIGEQSLALHEKLGSVDDPRVLPSLTGSVTTVLQGLYRNNPGVAQSIDVASLLADCAELPGIWKEEKSSTDEGTLGFRRTVSMMQAISPVIAAHQRFDFYHGRDANTLEDMQNLLWNTVEDTLNRQPAIAEMKEGEVELLRRNLLLRAGELLASAWDTQTPIAKAHINESTPDERRAFKTYGYPLDKVTDLFQSSYAMLERTFEVTLNANFEPTETHDEPENRPGM
ncbi:MULTISPECIES: hypothetical protein [Marinobacter]|uniref:Uncharacterized protein n=1 Tax=Marinobacter nauticus (strain ATCC 700491 / DSM 11845 / VT8) TaxID=351348 RepID=A1U7Z3_MARN8|nr:MULTISPECIES: hypothetical protein [Marinobacter]ABM21112.1 hypothetical protein Maqu_4261 [Marinobacter nauticus VT8]